uniref:Uncharacterized protein n=1 Tax=Spironucleus salmonicida TaxID=348837 RepID=V6M5W6_9EUKA|eukprot:EST48739.1 hypothetical protein SS50377_11057 [Spironucleus salmonicida]
MGNTQRAAPVPQLAAGQGVTETEFGADRKGARHLAIAGRCAAVWAAYRAETAFGAA